jgi:STE24 endopeptidase
MYSDAFTNLFIVFIVATVLVRLWLGARQIRHVLANRGAVPAEFAGAIPLAAHQKAADYTVAKNKFKMIVLLFNTAVLVGFTLLGGLQWLSEQVLALTGPGMAYQLGLLTAFVLVTGLLELPVEYYTQFVLEARFGFNKMTLGLFVTDRIKGALLGAVIGLPLAWVILTLMDKSGALWWFYAWLVWSGFQMTMMVLFPSVIAPLFNKFTPLADDSLKHRIEGLMTRVGFASKGLFVMDGSRRSAHGNAYFSGFGASKRIVFFDTLLARLAPQEIEAVLAHELGHFKLKHIVKRIGMLFVVSLAFLALLGYLKSQLWFFTGLGVDPLHPGAAGVYLPVLAADLDRFAQARIRSRRLRRPPQQRRRPGFGAGQALPGQRLHAHARPAAFGVLRFPPAGQRAHQPAQGGVSLKSRMPTAPALETDAIRQHEGCLENVLRRRKSVSGPARAGQPITDR